MMKQGKNNNSNANVTVKMSFNNIKNLNNDIKSHSGRSKAYRKKSDTVLLSPNDNS